jgi:trimethylamine--corrinoid protein Co-methyltransferase
MLKYARRRYTGMMRGASMPSSRAGLELPNRDVLTPLTRDARRRIVDGALRILEGTGVIVQDEEARRTLEAAGCTVNAKTGLVQMPSHVVQTAVKRTPRSFTLCARNKEHDVRIGTRRLFTDGPGNALYVLDVDTKTHRRGLLKDVTASSLLDDALEHFHSSAIPRVTASDAHRLHALAVAFNNFTKHARLHVFAIADIPLVLEMAATIVGGEDELRRRPIISALTQPVSPLTHVPLQTRTLVEFAQRGLPILATPHPILGMTAPTTLAGGLVVLWAELFSQITLIQSTNPGNPTIVGTSMSQADPRSGMILSGSVERSLWNLAFGQIAKDLNLPTRGHTGSPDSKVPDAEAALEFVTFSLPVVLAGNVDQINVYRLDHQLTYSYEWDVIQNEFYSVLDRFLRGFEVSGETLALDLIELIGPGGNFLHPAALQHTLKHQRREHYFPKLFSRTSRREWERAGRKDLWQRANDEVKRILGQHSPEPLDRDVLRRLHRIAHRAAAASG